MNAEIRPPKLRIVSGSPAEVEYELNRLLDDYAALVWNFSGTLGSVVVTVVLIGSSEIRKNQLMQIRTMGGPH